MIMNSILLSLLQKFTNNLHYFSFLLKVQGDDGTLPRKYNFLLHILATLKYEAYVVKRIQGWDLHQCPS